MKHLEVSATAAGSSPDSSTSKPGGSAADDRAGDDGGLTVVIPAYDEAENLPTVVRDVRDAFGAAALRPTILVVDDGSSDDTSAVLGQLAANWDMAPLRSVKHPRNLGLGVALRTGYIAAGTDWVGWLPADGQFRAEDLLSLYQARAGCVAVAGRVSVGQRRRADSLGRVVLSQGMRIAMRVLHPSMPPFNGIMVVQRRVIGFEDLVGRTGFVNMEILDRIRRAGQASRVAERPVTLQERRAGISKVANSRTVFLVLSDFVRLRMGYFGLRGR